MQIDQIAVNAAADAIVATGKKPTQTAVRDRLRGGSYTTIGPLLKAWAEARREALEDVVATLHDTVSRVTNELAG